MIRLYFPSTILVEYLDAVDIDDVKEMIRDSKVTVLKSLLKTVNDVDIHTTVDMPYTIKNFYKHVVDALRKKVLGKDVVLFFSKDFPIEIEAEEEYELVLDLNPKLLKFLKIRKRGVAGRFIIVHSVFKFFYNIYPTLQHLYREYRALPKFLNRRQDSLVQSLRLRFRFPRTFDCYELTHVFIPEQLFGFISSYFPLLQISDVINFSLINYMVSDEWSSIVDTVVDANIVDDWIQVLDHFKEWYHDRLKKYINDFKAILEEEDPIERFILSMDGCSVLKLITSAKAQGYDVDEVMIKLHDLVRRGKVKDDNMVLKVIR